MHHPRMGSVSLNDLVAEYRGNLVFRELCLADRQVMLSAQRRFPVSPITPTIRYIKWTPRPLTHAVPSARRKSLSGKPPAKASKPPVGPMSDAAAAGDPGDADSAAPMAAGAGMLAPADAMYVPQGDAADQIRTREGVKFRADPFPPQTSIPCILR